MHISIGRLSNKVREQFSFCSTFLCASKNLFTWSLFRNAFFRQREKSRLNFSCIIIKRLQSEEEKNSENEQWIDVEWTKQRAKRRQRIMMFRIRSQREQVQFRNSVDRKFSLSSLCAVSHIQRMNLCSWKNSTVGNSIQFQFFGLAFCCRWNGQAAAM